MDLTYSKKHDPICAAALAMSWRRHSIVIAAVTAGHEVDIAASRRVQT
jgi:hypothetical protein